MTTRSSMTTAILVLAAVGVGVGAAQLGLENNGVRFPDGTRLFDAV